MTIAAEVRAEMGRHKITTTELARATGIRRQTLSGRLNEHSSFTIRELIAIAQALGTTAGTLLGRAEEAAPTKTLRERDLTHAALADDTHGAPPATAGHGTRGARGRHSSACVSKEGSR